MRAPSPPPSPDPAVQTANESAANRYNINSPFGSQTWTTGGRETIGYDSTGKPIYGEQRTQNITLNPSEQRQYDTTNEIAELMLNQGKAGIEGGLPSYSALEANPGRPGNVDLGGKFDLNAASSPAADAHYKRIAAYLEPQFQRQTDEWEQRMANQGLPMGSEAYSESFGDLQDAQNRAWQDAAYESAERAPDLALQERGQQTNEALAAQSDARAGFSQYQSERDRQLNEDFARRQQYYNEIAAALGGQQLNPINAGGGGGDANLDVAGAFQQYNQAQMNAYNQKLARQNAIIGAAGQIGAAAIPDWG